jgi:hypothetical protein
VYPKTSEADRANAASHKAKWQIYFVIHATTGFTELDGKRFEMYGLRMKLNCGAKRSDIIIRSSTLDVRPARNALKLVRGKFNNLIHNSMITLTQRTMHGRRVFDVHFFSVNLPPSPGVNIS